MHVLRGAGESLPLYVDAGLSLTKLGEEAWVELARFSLDGKARAPRFGRAIHPGKTRRLAASGSCRRGADVRR